MAEKETFTLTPQEQPKKDDFDEILAMQEAEMRRSAQRIIDETLAAPSAEQPIEGQMELPLETTASNETSTQPNKLRKSTIVLGAGAALVASAAAGAAIGNATAPEFSEETVTYTVQPGDGLYDAAENIQGSFDMRDAVDYIEELPQNAVTLEDGLQPGETISIPISTEGYEEKND